MTFLETIQYKIVSREQAVDIVAQWKQQGDTIVFTNGCFDIIHKGHVHYLAQARDLGSKLIVGINTDESIKKLKGENRPVKELESRTLTMASFAYVDLVIPFAEDTPFELISAVIPHVLVKGSDYTEDAIVGADIVKQHGGKVTTIDFVTGFSSTNYFKKM